MHTLLECLYMVMPHIKGILATSNSLFEETFEISIELNIKNTVFNTNIEEFPLEIIHFILLFTKYYIHCCKWSNHLPTIQTLKCKLRMHY